MHRKVELPLRIVTKAGMTNMLLLSGKGTSFSKTSKGGCNINQELVFMCKHIGSSFPEARLLLLSFLVLGKERHRTKGASIM